MNVNRGSKKKNRAASFREREDKRIQKDRRKIIIQRQLAAAIEKGDIPTAARLMAEG